MSRMSFSQVWLWGTLVCAVIALIGDLSGDSQAIGQETATGASQAPASQNSAPQNSVPQNSVPQNSVPQNSVPQKKFQGRLPAYYRTVVDQKQREAIYAIQKEYWTQIEALKAQLEALTKQRDEKITAVLTPEQLKQVEATALAVKAKRSSAKTTEK
ncbi:MAG TPA: hypothetical protein VE890_00585 [Thermoguttaceae bacterium]|nr:hypothetical protein [Thermoguttaceae bacterium]